MQYTKINYTKDDILEVCNTSSISLTKEQLDEVYDWYTNGVPTTTYSSSIMILISIIEHVYNFRNYNKENVVEISTVGLRYNTNKPQWSLVDFKSLESMVKVLEYGKLKYSEGNWKKGLKTTEIVESTLRHLFAYLDGENIDKESSLPHVAHAQCNLMFLQYMMDNKPEFDNRIKIK